MSIGLDLDWTGSRLWQNVLNLGWIWTVNCFINLGSGPHLDWINGKGLRRFCYYKAVFCEYFGLYLDLDFNFFNLFGLWLDLDWVWNIQDWIWIAKFDSPLTSGLGLVRRFATKHHNSKSFWSISMKFSGFACLDMKNICVKLRSK